MAISAFDQPVVRKEFDRYDDTLLYQQAFNFCAGRPKLSASQIKGLENVSRSINKVNDLMEFITHQLDKARKSDKKEDADYWSRLKIELDKVGREVNNRWRRIKKERLMELTYDPTQEEEILEELHLSVIRDFIAHLAAENAMLEEDNLQGKGKVK